MKINTYLTFDGNTHQAIEFYKNVFGGTDIQIMHFGDMPPNPEFQMAEEAKNRILHAEMRVGNNMFFFSDTFPGTPFTAKAGDIITVAVVELSVETAHEIYGKLKVGGQEIIPIAESFWSPAYGMVIDKFGVKWQISAKK